MWLGERELDLVTVTRFLGFEVVKYRFVLGQCYEVRGLIQ